MGEGVSFATVVLQVRACEGAGGKPAFPHPRCSEPSLAAPLPSALAPHHAGAGCAVSSTGTGFAAMYWGIPAPWTPPPKRCKSLPQLQGGRQAAICDRHVCAQQGGGEGAAAPPFRPLSSHPC